MLPNRFTSSQSSGMRKSRLEGKPSLLPLPRRPGSTDRLSTEARRPSTTGLRSSSAEPARGTFGARLSREASVTKLPLNGRSRSQTGDSKFGQSTTTPMRSSHYSTRPTTTPVRTPSEDRASRSWQASLDRALAFVTIKDQRAVSSAAWQRAATARVAEALAARGQAGALLRPLTIARFVDIAAALLAPLTRDAKLNTDNYVTKLPHVSKRLLYPGAVSKSWLRTVNTLHAFPHALALIAYLLDLVTHVETPVLDEWLYTGKDELAFLRRDYLYKCWIRFQDPDHQYEDLNQEYLQNLRALLGNDEEKIVELQQIIKKYEVCLEDEVEVAARADEARRAGRRDALAGGLRGERAARAATGADVRAARAALRDRGDELRALDVDIERATAAAERLRRELEEQPLSLEQRTALLDQVDYSHRVLDSKRTLAIQISKMILSKETELALWQKKTLDSCVEYKQGLIHLSAQFPALASLAIDEKELMEPECGERVARAADALREEAGRLSARRAAHARQRTALSRRRAAQLEETRAKITELKMAVEKEQQALDAEVGKEATEAAVWSAEEAQVGSRLQELGGRREEYERAHADLEFWEGQDAEWKSRLASLKAYIEEQKIESARALESALAKRLQLVGETLRRWDEKLEGI